NICTNRLKTTCASKMLENFIPPYDATVIGDLKKDGALLLGKTNMDEFAMGSSTENSAFKLVRNPWDTECVPGGSSGGSAAAVASGEAAFALGSDTGGSIRQPASFCGLVGIKPTYGLVSRYGLVAFASSLDQIGAFTKDVEDMAVVLNSIAGYDEKDSTSYKMDKKDYRKALGGDVKGMKIGIPAEYFKEGISSDVKSSVLDAAKVFESLGAEVVDISLPYTEYALAVYYILASAEASSNLARFDGIRYGYRSKKFEDSIDIYINSRTEGFGDEVKRRI
ncbi:MAG TPA: Asp-tRNA(Asn)/Glu-tRNA(Gln) amidotransferase subunit GatA, partial [Clostridiaceae bacterium]|nr:Asp-tRNA(Asn)/Glu-tRNA(Gln) amidotransferase subunit GatA [Clostridiaceae bacterium]